MNTELEISANKNWTSIFSYIPECSPDIKILKFGDNIQIVLLVLFVLIRFGESYNSFEILIVLVVLIEFE